MKHFLLAGHGFMRLTQMLASIFAAGLFLSSATAATYYIDFATGNDSNSGTSIAAPWKRHPFMANEAVNYTPSPGDRFIFKGGVVWTDSFPLLHNVSGGLSSRYYYGTSETWGSGRAVFDGMAQTKSLIELGTSVSNLTIANIELRNHARSAAIYAVAPTFTTFTNLYIHKWWRGGATIDGNGGGIYNNYAGTSGGRLTQFLITHCIIKNPDGDSNFGVCVRGCGELAFSELGYAPELQLHGGYSIHDTEFHNCTQSFMGDAAQHPNVTYLDNFNGTQLLPSGKAYFYNNYIRDIRDAGVQIIGVNLGSGGLGNNGEIYIYNNVVINTPNNRTIPIDNYFAGSGTAFKIYIWNNTLENTKAGGIVIGYVYRSGIPPPHTISYFNNHFIGPATAYIPAGTLNTLSGNNIWHTSITEAQNAGYNAANFYMPERADSITLQAGVNFLSSGLSGIASDTSRGNQRVPRSRRSSGPWDIGAYLYGSGSVTNPLLAISPASLEFGSILAGTTKDMTIQVRNAGAGTLSGSAAVSSPFAIVSGGTYSLGSNQSQIVTVRFQPTTGGSQSGTVRFTGGNGAEAVLTGTASPVQNGLNFEAENGEVNAPFVTSGGSVYQTVQTSATTGGRAMYYVQIPAAGDYRMEGVVNAPSEAENSLFVAIDQEPQDPYMVWLIPVTSGFETRMVNWQGNGTWNAPQFNPKVFSLTAGTHQIIVRGREANTKLDRLSLVLVGDAPGKTTGLRVLAAPAQ